MHFSLKQMMALVTVACVVIAVLQYSRAEFPLLVGSLLLLSQSEDRPTLELAYFTTMTISALSCMTSVF